MLISIAALMTCLQEAHAKTLTFEKVLQQAVNHSFDLKISVLDVEIGEQRLVEVRSNYLPTLSVQLAGEYLYDFNNNATGTVSVGDTVISGNESTYQDSLSLSAGYLLYDFGARSLKYQNAERDLQEAHIRADQALVDLRDQTLSVYGRGLILHKQLMAWRILLKQRNEVYRLTQRLQTAGTMGKVELGNAGIAVAEAVQTLTSYQLDMEGVAQDLSYLTGRKYDALNLVFADLQPAAFSAAGTDVNNLPEIKVYAVEIEKKKTEYQIARREWLPTLNLYSSYRMYGNDTSSAVESFGNMRERNVTIGVVLDMKIFNGFSDRAKVERLQRELRRLEVERDKKIADKRRLVNTLAEKAGIYNRCANDWQFSRELLNKQGAMTERLAGQLVIDRISFLQQQGKQLEKSLDLQVKQVERTMNTLQLQLLALGGT